MKKKHVLGFIFGAALTTAGVKAHAPTVDDVVMPAPLTRLEAENDALRKENSNLYYATIALGIMSVASTLSAAYRRARSPGSKKTPGREEKQEQVEDNFPTEPLQIQLQEGGCGPS